MRHWDAPIKAPDAHCETCRREASTYRAKFYVMLGLLALTHLIRSLP